MKRRTGVVSLTGRRRHGEGWLSWLGLLLLVLAGAAVIVLIVGT